MHPLSEPEMKYTHPQNASLAARGNPSVLRGNRSGRLGLRRRPLRLGNIHLVVLPLIVVLFISSSTEAAGPTEAGLADKPRGNNDSSSLQYQSFEQRIRRTSVDSAVALTNLQSLQRIEKSSRLAALYQSMIDTERVRLALRRSMARRREIASSHSSSVNNNRSFADRKEIRSQLIPAQLDPSPTVTDNVQVTRFENGDQIQGSPVVTLIKPRKVTLDHLAKSSKRSQSEPHDLAVDEVEARPNDRDDFAPIVVEHPPAGKLRSSDDVPAIQIGLVSQSEIQTHSETTHSKTTHSETQRPDEVPQHGAASDRESVEESSVRTVTLQVDPFDRQGNQSANQPAPQPRTEQLESTEVDSSLAELAKRESSAVSEPQVNEKATQVIQQAPQVTPSVSADVTVLNPATATPPPQASDDHRAVPFNLGPPARPVSENRVAMQWPFKFGQREQLPPPQDHSNVTLNVDSVDVRTVLEMLAKGYGMNILVAPDVEGTVTANVSGLSPEQTLRSVVRMCGLAIEHDDDVILVYPKDNLPREARQLKVFPLDFARSELLEPTITGLLSPVGSAYSSKVDEQDNRRGREAIVVIDTPDVLEQVQQYVLQADQPPRQVMIEARVLEITLKDDLEHGVNIEHLIRGDLRAGAFRITDNIATSTDPFFFAEINGADLKALITMLETTTDAKTLATPRVMCVNGQNAKIQVGQQLGFAVATVTQTSTIQDVRYLDTGVVLDVTPTISRDNRILMQVRPKVSTGEINPDTLLPEETTRQIETSVMLDNHQGMIVGGLIQEEDRVVIRKLPWLGDVKHVGKFFQRRETSKMRTEIIVALIPHIVQLDRDGHCQIPDPMDSADQWDRTENRLFHGPLNRQCRPSEPRLPDSTAETHFHRDIDRMRNDHPYCKGCQPLSSGLLESN